MIRNRCSELAQTDHRVVGRLQVAEFLAEETMQPPDVSRGQVVRRRQRPCKGHTDEEPQEPCGEQAAIIVRN